MIWRHVSNKQKEIIIRESEIKYGSIHMNLNNGRWYRFSRKEGGDIYQFICLAKECSIKQAASIIKEYLETGICQDDRKESARDDRLVLDSISKTKEKWVLAEERPEHIKPFDAKFHLKYLLDQNKLEAVYRYCNGKGELLLYGAVAR